ncbi:hypothetical protein MTBPR1_70108 [Candidatus Terasakiella magnetica]|uniref:Sulfotransferase family protein n=1 Tax=Candidatus Terasakiella magnetica TaxID=1867952 RepID=A0A1C3RKQ6_9PROT|nr:sulfotransferase family 2 domain-containing protein [Candidatus Terasakiella magnetica]SCA57836.1 hypothetical protein MTBPR1_70108 [Candidatus Terasakiella magnetica]
MSETLLVHLGIVRTGSSSVRRLVRDYCQIKGETCSHFPETEDEPVTEQTRYLFTECPYPYHLDTDRHCQYFTTIRNPVDSVISEYFFYLEREKLDASVSLDDFIAALPKSYNKQARWIAAINSPDKKLHTLEQPRNMFEHGFYEDISDQDLLMQVQASAGKYFPCIGLLERMEESAFQIAAKFGWSTVPILSRMNASFKDEALKREKPTELQIAKIKECNRADDMLYQAVEHNFNQEISQIRSTLAEQMDFYKQECKRRDEELLKKRREVFEKVMDIPTEGGIH